MFKLRKKIYCDSVLFDKSWTCKWKCYVMNHAAILLVTQSRDFMRSYFLDWKIDLECCIFNTVITHYWNIFFSLNDKWTENWNFFFFLSSIIEYSKENLCRVVVNSSEVYGIMWEKLSKRISNTSLTYCCTVMVKQDLKYWRVSKF